MKQKIFALSGTFGSGKGTVTDYLVKKYNFTHLSVTEFLSNEIRKRGLEVNRNTLHATANGLRARNGGEYIMRVLYEQAVALGTDCIIEAVSSPLESDYLGTQSGVVLVGVTAPVQLRYERIRTRNSVKDNVSFKEFLEQENRELDNVDPLKQNIGYCISKVRPMYLIHNIGSKKELHGAVDTMMSLFG